MTQQERISETIAQMNREREQDAAHRTRTAIANIACLVKQRQQLDEALTKARADLAAITYEPVNAADILG